MLIPIDIYNQLEFIFIIFIDIDKILFSKQCVIHPDSEVRHSLLVKVAQPFKVAFSDYEEIISLIFDDIASIKTVDDNDIIFIAFIGFQTIDI